MDSPSMLETLLEKDFNSFVDSTHVASSSQLAADFKPSQDFVVPQLVPDGYEFPVFVDSTHVASSSQLAADFKPSQDFVLPQSVPDGDEFPVNAQHLINLANDRYWKDPLECSFSFPSHEVENGNPFQSVDIVESRRIQSSGRPRGKNVLLQQWYDEHRDYPYPSKEEKTQLAVASDKSFKQVCQWFTNHRARQRHLSLVNHFDASRYLTPSLSLSPTSSIVSPNTEVENGVDLQFLPVNQNLWHTEAVSSPQIDPLPQHGNCVEYRLNMSSNFGNTPANSMPSAKSKPLSGRKGKRRISAAASHNSPAAVIYERDSGSKTFACTFGCRLFFKDNYDWRKHEVTHLPEMWICMPDGGWPIFDDSCVFCGLKDPQVSHFKTHNGIEQCRNAPQSRRCFARKDHLRNHIKRMHAQQLEDTEGDVSKPRNSAGPDLLDGWYREPPELALNYPGTLWCGFCQTFLSSWAERLDHVGTHLGHGESFSNWRPLN